MVRQQGQRESRLWLAAAALLLAGSQLASPAAGQQLVYSPGRGGTAYTPTALAAIDETAPAPAPGGSTGPQSAAVPAPSSGGGSGGAGGPPPYTVLAAVIVGAGLCISVVACLCVRRLAMITHTRRLAQATDVLDERRRRAIAMATLSGGDDPSGPVKPLAPVHVVVMPDASIFFAMELNSAGEYVRSDLAVRGAAADVSAAAAAAARWPDSNNAGGAAAANGADAAVYAEDINDAEVGGITVTRLRVCRPEGGAGSGRRPRRVPTLLRPAGSPQAQHYAWDAIRAEIARGNVPSRGDMLLLGSLGPMLSAPPPGEPPAPAGAAGAAGGGTGNSAAGSTATTQAAAPQTAGTAAAAAGATRRAAAQPGPSALQGWMAMARTSLARGSSRLMYGGGDPGQASAAMLWGVSKSEETTALDRASSQGLQRSSASGGPPPQRRSGSRLPRISGSACGGVDGTGDDAGADGGVAAAGANSSSISGSSVAGTSHQPTLAAEVQMQPQQSSRPGSTAPLQRGDAGGPAMITTAYSGELRQKYGLAGDETSGRSSP